MKYLFMFVRFLVSILFVKLLISMSYLIRGLVPTDIIHVKSIIDENELFPSEMIDDMTSTFLDGKTEEHKWIVAYQEGEDKIVYRKKLNT